MGQVFSTAFIEKFLNFAKPARKRRRRKGRKKSFWNFLINFLFPSIWITSAKKPTFKNEKIETDEAATFCSENHNHIVCEHAQDKFIGVMSFLSGKEKFKYVDVPGKKVKIKVTQDFVRRLLIGVLFRFRHLHSEGKTLNGCFTVENICAPICNKDQDALVTPYIEVKLGYVQSDSFSDYTKEGGEKDLMKVGWILQHKILSSETELPADLKQLLELMCTDPIKNQHLIYNHVSLMAPRDQISHFLWLYKRLMFLKKKVPEKYDNIVEKIVKGDWRTDDQMSKFLMKLDPFKYSGDGKGLSRFYRNSVEHLFKLIKDDKANSASVVEEEEEQLEDYHIIYILTEAFPELLGNLQKAFHEEDEFLTFTTYGEQDRPPPPLLHTLI